MTIKTIFSHFFLAFFFFLPSISFGIETPPQAIKVGILISKTGVMADIGSEGLHGFLLAIEQLKTSFENSRIKTEFIFEDSKSTPELAVTAVNKLIKSDKVDVILGDLTSTATLAAAPLAQSAKIPLLTPSSTNDKVTQVGDFIFRACYIDSFQGIAMAQYATEILKAKSAVLLIDKDMDHSRDLSSLFRQEFEKRGGKVLKSIFISGSHDTSYVPQMTELRNLKPDVIYAPIYYTQMSLIFKNAKSFKISAQILGTDAWDSPQLFKLANGTTDGALMTDPFSAQNPSVDVVQFRNQFHTLFNQEPSSYGALAFDSVRILAQALSRIQWPCKNPPIGIQHELLQTKNVVGITGNITLDANRNVQKTEITILRLTKDAALFETNFQVKTK